MVPRILNVLPEEDGALSRLWLNATDAAKVCGVTVRQLTYWTDRGIIPSSSHDGRSYDVAALDKAIAVDRAMASGLTLEKAARQLEGVEQSSSDAEPAEASGMVADIDNLVALLEAYRRGLGAHLAMANFRRAAAGLAAVEVEMVLAGADDQAEQALLLAARLNAVADVVDSAAADILAGQSSQLQLGQTVSAGA